MSAAAQLALPVLPEAPSFDGARPLFRVPSASKIRSEPATRGLAPVYQRSLRILLEQMQWTGELAGASQLQVGLLIAGGRDRRSRKECTAEEWARICRAARRLAIRHLAELESAGLIDRQPTSNDYGGRGQNVYVLGKLAQEILEFFNVPPSDTGVTPIQCSVRDGRTTIISAAAGGKPVDKRPGEQQRQAVQGERPRRSRRAMHPLLAEISAALPWELTEADVNTLNAVAWCWLEELRPVLVETSRRVGRWEERPERLGAAVRCDAVAYLVERGLPIPEPLRGVAVGEAAHQRARALIASRGEPLAAPVDDVDPEEQAREARVRRDGEKPAPLGSLLARVAGALGVSAHVPADPEEDPDEQHDVEDPGVAGVGPVEVLGVSVTDRDGRVLWSATEEEVDRRFWSYTHTMRALIRSRGEGIPEEEVDQASEEWVHRAAGDIAGAGAWAQWRVRAALRELLQIPDPLQPDPEPQDQDGPAAVPDVGAISAQLAASMGLPQGRVTTPTREVNSFPPAARTATAETWRAQLAALRQEWQAEFGEQI
ncbi:MAG: hypothetical protein AB1941_19135 [Gemmatimonadota bacterium]